MISSCATLSRPSRGREEGGVVRVHIYVPLAVRVGGYAVLHRPRIAGGVEHSALGVVGEPALPGGGAGKGRHRLRRRGGRRRGGRPIGRGGRNGVDEHRDHNRGCTASGRWWWLISDPIPRGCVRCVRREDASSKAERKRAGRVSS